MRQDGGAISNFGALSITNSTFSGNDGGGMARRWHSAR